MNLTPRNAAEFRRLAQFVERIVARATRSPKAEAFLLKARDRMRMLSQEADVATDLDRRELFDLSRVEKRLRPIVDPRRNEPAPNMRKILSLGRENVFGTKADLSKDVPVGKLKAAIAADDAKRFQGEAPVRLPTSPHQEAGERLSAAVQGLHPRERQRVIEEMEKTYGKKGSQEELFLPGEAVTPIHQMRQRAQRVASAQGFEAKGETIKAAFVRRSLRQDDLLAAMETGQKEPKLPVRPWKGGLNRNRTEMALGPESHKVNGLDHKVKGLEQALKEAVSEGVSPTEAGEDAAAVLFRFASGQDDARRVETLGKMTLAELGQKAPFLSELLAKQVREKGLASGNEGVRTFLRNTGRADPRQINVLQVVRALAAGKGHGEQTKMLKGVLVKPGGGFPLYKYADDRNLNAPGSEALREIARQKRAEKRL